MTACSTWSVVAISRRPGDACSGEDGIFVTVVGPERFIGDRALGWAGVLAVLARVGYRIISSRIRGPRYVLTGPSPSGGKALADVARAAAAGVLPPIDSTSAFRTRADATGSEARRGASEQWPHRHSDGQRRTDLRGSLAFLALCGSARLYKGQPASSRAW